MDSLTLKNIGAHPLIIPDMGVEILVGEDLDLIPGFKNEEILESLDFPSIYTNGGQIILTTQTQTYTMSYQDVVDYLTPLTKWSKLDYKYISDRDDVTDITATELEQLTGGDNTSLHKHDDRYYTETELSTPGMAVIHWSNIVGSPAGDTRIINNDVYFLDSVRQKWLSLSEVQYIWSESVVDGKYISIGNVIGADGGYLLPQNFTITKLAVSSSPSGHPTKDMEVRVDGIVKLSFSLVNGRYSSSTLNIDVDSGEIISMFVSGAGNPAKDVVATIYGKWRA